MEPVGSSFDVHDCNSLNDGAASTCEFAAVNSVKQNCFYEQTHQVKARQSELWTHPKKSLLVGVTLNIHSVEANDTDLLEFIGTRVHVKVRSAICVNDMWRCQRKFMSPSKDKPPLAPDVLDGVCENE